MTTSRATSSPIWSPILLGKVADEIASAKLVIPWLFGTLGVPAVFTGLLVPIREAGVLVPQLAVAAAVRSLPIRKGVWVLGAVMSAASLFAMAAAALILEGAAAGWGILIALVIFSLARGLCSVSAKDVLGKTVSKSRRDPRLSRGWSASNAGIATLGVGLWLGVFDLARSGLWVFAVPLAAGGVLWIIALSAFAAIREQLGATEGGGNALAVALAQLRLLSDDPPFRAYKIGRALLLAVALAPPFYVLIAQGESQGDLLGLGALIIANGLAASLSAPFWGYWGDRSSRQVMSAAAAGSGLLGVFTFVAVTRDWVWSTGELGLAAIFLVLNVMHGGIRLGRKVYLQDLASGGNRGGLHGRLQYGDRGADARGRPSRPASRLTGRPGDCLGARAGVLGVGRLCPANRPR